MNTQYTFLRYYKYSFYLLLENGKTITNDDESSDDIYRLGIEATGDAKEDGEGQWIVDGVVFK